MSWILGAVGLVEGFGGGELGSWGVKGEGGIARLEERKGVDGIVSVERMVFCVGFDRLSRLLRCQGFVLIRVTSRDENPFRLSFRKDRGVC